MTDFGSIGDAQDAMQAGLVMGHNLDEHIDAPHFTFEFECFDQDGNLKWKETVHNTVVTGGKNNLLDNYFAGSAYTAAFFLGLKGTGSVAAGDTLSSHAGWAEVNPYSGNRPSISWSSASSGSKTASAAVSYAITSSATVAGAFIATVNTGTAGVLYSAGDFSASRSVQSGDTLNVTPTVSV